MAALDAPSTGVAPIAREVLHFSDACGIRIREAWGMTETTAAGTLNTVGEYRFGSVGKSLPGVAVQVAEDGEVLIKGPNVLVGYYKNEEATREALHDGWLRPATSAC